MCGITGFWPARSLRESELADRARAMSGTLAHRGPDDEGFAVAENGPVLCHRRLAIIDVSQDGHQPMVSASGRYVIVYNGEFYNFISVRAELERQGHAFRTKSDTEVLLAAMDRWGVEDAVKRVNGMFAFAVWDRVNRALWLGRDRLGKKPLYLGWAGNDFVFGSELKALRAHPQFAAEVNRDALTLYFRHNYVPAPHSIYRGVQKLPPGTLIAISDRDVANHALPEVREYWSLNEVALRGCEIRDRDSNGRDTLGALDELLRDAVALRMISDVPLGAFLSGGIDSSLVVALMQEQASAPVRTFTVGYAESSYNEAVDAAAVARCLGTDHTELYVSPEDALAVVPHLATLYDEPFADASQIPTFLVAQLARRHVTVALSGDGGDEMFGGYNRYFWGARLWSILGSTPRVMRTAMARAMVSVRPSAWDRANRVVTPFVPPRARLRMAGDRVHKLAGLVDALDERDLYRRLVSLCFDPDRMVKGGTEPPGQLSSAERSPDLPTFVDWMMCLDTATYLPDDILVKVDRASMAVSLEARAPLLDYRVCEFAWSLPLTYKVRDGQGKWALRQLLYRRVPRSLVERPKMGFGVPIDSWLRGPLLDWAEDLIEPGRLRRDGFLDETQVRRKWEEHLSGTRNWQYYLWAVLVFQMWLESQTSVVC